MKDLKNTQGPENQKILCLHPDHPKPVTRRQLLAAGIISGSGYLMMPSKLMQLFSPKMLQVLGAPAFIPVFEVSGAGGFCAAEFFEPSGPGGLFQNGTGDFLPAAAYQAVGHTQGAQSDTPNTQLGLPLNPNSAFTNALISGATVNGSTFAGLSAGAIAGTRAFAFCTQSQDDNAGNPYSWGSWVASVAKDMSLKTILPRLGVGGGSIQSGARHNDVAFNAAFTPLRVNNKSTPGAAISPGSNFKSFSMEQQNSILSSIGDLAGAFGTQMANYLRSSEYSSLAQQAHAQNLSLLNNPPNTDPTTDATSTSVWGTNGAIAGGDQVNATLSFNLFNGFTPFAATQLGGCDYHGQGAGVFTSIHQQLAMTVGRVLNHAAAVGSPVYIVLDTDGATQCTPGLATGDDGDKGSGIVFYFNPSASNGSQYVNGTTQNVQLGNFLANGAGTDMGVSSTTVNGGSVPITAALLFANWLNCFNQFGTEYNQYAGAVLPPSTASNYLIFQG